MLPPRRPSRRARRLRVVPTFVHVLSPYTAMLDPLGTALRTHLPCGRSTVALVRRFHVV